MKTPAERIRTNMFWNAWSDVYYQDVSSLVSLPVFVLVRNQVNIVVWAQVRDQVKNQLDKELQ